MELTDTDLWYFGSGDWLKVATEEIDIFVTAIETKLVLTVGEIFTVICPLNRVLQKKDLAFCTNRHLLAAWQHNTIMLTDHDKLSEKLGQKGEAVTIGKQDKTYTENYHWHCLFICFFVYLFVSFFLCWLIWFLKTKLLVWILHMWIVSIQFHRSITITLVFPCRKPWIAAGKNTVCISPYLSKRNNVDFSWVGLSHCLAWHYFGTSWAKDFPSMGFPCIIPMPLVCILRMRLEFNR